MKVPSPLARCIADEQAYLVGGAVRDHLLGRPIADYDLVVAGDPLPAAMRAASILGKRPFLLGRGDQTVYRIVTGETVYDFAALQGETLVADLARRDFTINAMAYDLTTQSIVDPLGGREDIEGRRIRLASPKALSTDPLRMLRAFRFAALLGFRIPPDVSDRIAATAQRITEASAERISAELFKVMAVTPSAPYVRQAVDTGVLTGIIPELVACSGCTQGGAHDRDVLAHLLDTYEALEGVLSDFSTLWPTFSRPLADYLDRGDRQVLLKWAALLHDLGKPAVRRRDGQGRIRFIGHEAEGVRLMKQIVGRLRVPQRQGDYMTRIVGGHRRVAALFDAHERQALSNKALVRCIATYGEDIMGLLVHAVADQSAKAEASRRSIGRLIAFAGQVLDRYLVDLSEKMKMPPLVTGHDLMACFDLRPSEQVGRLLRGIEAARLEGYVTTRDEALRLAGDMLETDDAAVKQKSIVQPINNDIQEPMKSKM